LGPKEAIASLPQADAYYTSLDVDVIDPSLSPATGTPVPGGFTYYQVNEMLSEIARKGKVVGFDFVEIAPAYDLRKPPAG
jgi:agmatinase